MSDMLRITGMASGMDTDTMVKKMMKPYIMRVDKLKQDRQIVQWRQDLYRDVMKDVKGFTDNYFDVLKKDNYMLASNSYSGFDVSTDNSAIANATAGVGAINGTYTMEKIKLAKPACFKTDSTNMSCLIKQGGEIPVKPIIDSTNNKININGNAIEITSKTYEDMWSLANEINSKLNAQKVTDVMATVSEDGMGVSFTPIVKIDDSNKDININVNGKDYKVTLPEGPLPLKYLTDMINKEIANVKDEKGDKILIDKIQAKLEYGAGKCNISFNKLDSSTAHPSTIAIDGADCSSTIKKFECNQNITGNNINNGSLNFKMNITSGVNDELLINIAGSSYKVKLDEGSYDKNILINTINEKLKEAVNLTGNKENISDKVKVELSKDGQHIQFVNSTTSTISIGGNAIKTLGFNAGTVDLGLVSNDKMSSLISGVVSFKINDKDIKFNFDGADKNKSINDIISEISATANVKVSYSELAKKFTLESSNTGSDEKINITGVENSSNTADFAKLFGIQASEQRAGSDASVQITDPNNNTATVNKSKNIFLIDGVLYNLQNETKDGEKVKITITNNTDKPFDKIKGFIDKYNELIDKIGKKVEEKKSKGFTPLTDEQKKDMKPEEIEKWERRAKEGLLKSDSNLQSMLTQLRGSFFAGVEGAGMSLTELGLSTSRDTTERGKIVFDTYTDKNGENGEARLKRALKEKGDKVANLFTKNSTDVPAYTRDLTSEDRKKRTSQEGILHRINDILQDYTTTKLDKAGNRGILVEKSGIKGTASEFKNLLYMDMADKDKRIKEMEKQLSTRENKFYMQFAQLEKAMNNMNSQSSWLAQQLGGGK